jgi:Ca2+-binding EF-hand superfamily protein
VEASSAEEHFEWFCKVNEKETVNYKAYVLALASTMGVGGPDERYGFAFKVFDVDNSGSIEEPEFQLLVSSLMMGTAAHKDGLRMKFQSSFANYDSDGDGALDKEEFMEACRHSRTLQICSSGCGQVLIPTLCRRHNLQRMSPPYVAGRASSYHRAETRRVGTRWVGKVVLYSSPLDS